MSDLTEVHDVAIDVPTPPDVTAPAPAGAGAVGSEPIEPSREAAAIAGARQLDAALGAIRVGVGVALVVAPRWAGRLWVGPGADGPGSLVFARALGARDVALGLRILEAVQNGRPTRPWVTAGFVADGADLVASMLAGRHLSGPRRTLIPMAAGLVGAAGVWSARQPR